MKYADAIRKIEMGDHNTPLHGMTGRSWHAADIIPGPVKCICPHCDKVVIELPVDAIPTLMSFREKLQKTCRLVYGQVMLSAHAEKYHSDVTDRKIIHPREICELFHIRPDMQKFTGWWLEAGIGKMDCDTFTRTLANHLHAEYMRKRYGVEPKEN